MLTKYYKSSDLVDRLCSAANRKDRNVTFLVGSALTLPDHVGGHGVPGVSGIVDLIRREFEGSDAETEFDQNLKGASTDQYQKAFEFLHGRRGQDVANRIVRTAVWQAVDVNNWPSRLPETSPDKADPAICKALEREADAWILPRAVDLLGNLLVTCFDTFGGTVLTTNFDPLIEVSVSKHGGRCYRTVLHDDGKLGLTVAEGTHIVHLHGYWQGSDTLHIPHQLVQPRPQIGKSLARLVESSTLVVVGYRGWDDVITRTLVESLSDSANNPDIMWAFHEDDTAAIEASNERLLAVLRPGIDRGRVSLYQGIDCCSVLSEVYEQLQSSYSPASDQTSDPRVITVVKENHGGGTGPRQIHVEIRFPLPHQASADSDRPLFVASWVGRDQELSILRSLIQPVAFITGLGGQGKSALAGRFLKEQAAVAGGRFEVWTGGTAEKRAIA